VELLDLNGIKVKNRIWLTSGAAGYGEGYPYEKPLIKLGLMHNARNILDSIRP
jgi:hypothetical protein